MQQSLAKSSLRPQHWIDSFVARVVESIDFSTSRRGVQNE